MEPFATVADLEGRWRELSDPERERAATALLDATAYISSRLRKRGIETDPDDELQRHNLMWVTCNIAKRALACELSAAAEHGAPIKGYRQSADVFSEEYDYANPLGDMYLTSQEEVALGLSGMRVKVVPVGGRDDGKSGDA